jgi:hypothetical protein
LGKYRSTLKIWKELTVGVRRVDQEAGNYQSLSFYNLIYIYLSPFPWLTRIILTVITRQINYVTICHD